MCFFLSRCVFLCRLLVCTAHSFLCAFPALFYSCLHAKCAHNFHFLSLPRFQAASPFFCLICHALILQGCAALVFSVDCTPIGYYIPFSLFCFSPRLEFVVSEVVSLLSFLFSLFYFLRWVFLAEAALIDQSLNKPLLNCVEFFFFARLPFSL